MISTLALLLQSDNTAAGNALGAIFGTGFMLVMLAFFVLMVASLWKIFTKAGEPGWAAIIPIYNVIVLLKVCGRPLWWFVLLLIPFVNMIIGIILGIDLAKRFGKGGGFAAGLIILPFIFYPVLGFGEARYQGA